MQKATSISKKLLVSRHLQALLDFYTRMLSLIEQLLKADLRLSLYSGFLSGTYVWMRPMFPTDAFALGDTFIDPKNMQYFGSGETWSKNEIISVFHRNSYGNLSKPHTAAWSILSHQGLTGCFWLSRSNKNYYDLELKETAETAEIGYCLHPTFSGRGYTSEAGNLVMDSETPEFNGLIFATVHPKNKGSQKVLEKMGLEPQKSKLNVYIEKYKAPRHFYFLPNRK